MAQYAAQKTVTDQTLISLSQLDAKYQKVALSALNLSEAERQEINTKLQGLAAGSLMTGQQMQELLMDTNLDAATKKRILSETGLTNAIGVSTMAEKAYVQTQLQELMNRGVITEDIYKAIMAKMADVGATNAMTGANMGLATSFKTLMASIPVWGWIALAISAVISVLQTVIPMIKSSGEQLEEAANTVKSNNDEIESLNNELKTTQERIDELKSKGKLSFTDSSELKRLKAENAEREHTIWLLQQENAEKSKGAAKAFDEAVSMVPEDSLNLTYFYPKEELDNAFEEFVYDFTKDYIDRSKGTYTANEVEDMRGKLYDLLDSGYEYGTDVNLDKKIDYVYQVIDAYDAYRGATDTLYATILSRPKFAEANTEIQKLIDASSLNVSSLLELYNNNDNVKELVEHFLTISNLDWGAILGEDFRRVASDDGVVSTAEALDWMSEGGENSAKIMSLLAEELNKAEGAAEDAEGSFKSIAQTLSDGLDKLNDKKDILSEVKEQLNSFGAISADNISKILEQFADDEGVQEAVAYYLSGIGTAQQVYDAMAKGYQNDLKLQAQTLATKMQNDEKYYEAIGGINQSFIEYMAKNYGINLSQCKTLAKAKLEVENTLIGSFKNNWGKYYSWVNSISATNIDAQIKEVEATLNRIPKGKIGRPEVRTHYQDMLAELKAIKATMDSAKKEIDELILKDFETSGFNTSLNTDFDKGSGKTEAEKYFAKLKYNLETNKITEEQYLKALDAAYKKYYGNKSKYLEEYEQYSQEVYDGFKDMYKEDLEAQKEAWEEKKDAVSEYYDNLREQIENARDEEDYEKEQSEKRKEIFDLEMQIAELMRDGSEKAKARIAELEEERLKAEEELLEFETDKAREDELSRLEKEQEAEEKKIQDKIDGIQEQLDKLDEDTISVRNAIVAYAKQKGVTLSFAYASGTRSSVGGIGRINEKGIEMISAPDGNGNYVNLMPNSYVFSAKATEFLWKLATEHSLPQAMYNSIAKSIKTQSSTPSVNIAQPINITMGDVIIKGNADKQTVADIKKQQENTVRMVLQKIKELQK